MSYPPYQQAPDGSQPPYPQQGGMPYPTYSSAPYPPQGIFPPSIGMPMNAPMYMPQPYANAAPAPYPTYGGNPGYPSGGGNPGYPSGGNNPGYPSGPGYPEMSPTGIPHQGGYGPPPPGPPTETPSAYPPPGGVPVYPGLGNGSNSNISSSIQYTPTLRPANPFDPRADAEILRKAMKGFGTDEKAIINVLGRRTNAQRLEIAVQFKTLYGKDLIKDLKSETSGKFEDLLVALMTPLPTFYAKELNHAVSGIGTNEETLIEIMCSLSNNEIRCITAAYQACYFRPLEQDLRDDTSGTFKRLMVSLCTGGRDESQHVNGAQAAADAQALYNAGELQWGTDESTFNMIMCQRSYPHLRAVFDEYNRIAGRDIEDAVKSEFSGNSEDGLLAIIRCVRNRPEFYAKMLHASVKGLGTNDRQLIRLVSTRCEVDMDDIKRCYQAKYGESLADAISGDASGHYKKLLLCLIGDY